MEAWYRRYRSERERGGPPGFWEYWPEPSIRFCEIGCAIAICIDCTTNDGRVFMDDPNKGDDGRECLLPVADSLAVWLSDWLAQPWPEKRYS